MNFGQIKSEVGRLLNDPNNTRWSSQVILDRANEAQNEICVLTKAHRNRRNYTATANQAYIDIGNLDIIDITNASLTDSSGNIYPLEGITREELQYRYPDYQNWDAGAPRFYLFESLANRLFLFPTPDADHAVDSGTSLWTVIRPSDMDDDEDVPFDDDPGLYSFHMAIVHYVVSYCWMDEGTPEAITKSIFHRSGIEDRPGQYEKYLKMIKSLYDSVSDTRQRIQTKPQGGRLGRWLRPSKAYPFYF